MGQNVRGDPAKEILAELGMLIGAQHQKRGVMFAAPRQQGLCYGMGVGPVFMHGFDAVTVKMRQQVVHRPIAARANSQNADTALILKQPQAV